LIGITTSAATIAIADEPLEVRYAPEVYGDAVWRAGGLPVHVPPFENPLAADLVARLDGLILSGGGDVDPRTYGDPRHPLTPEVELDGRRDAGEQALIHAALELELPVLGVCRGAQILNVALGGTLIQHLPDAGLDGHHLQHVPTDAPRHPVVLERGSRLAAIFGAERIDVNSVHHQGIAAVAPGLAVSARSADGTIEGLEAERDDGWVVAVQWHPEAMEASDVLQRRLFDALVERAGARAVAR
jgi:putative glutamine amidotransferase